MKRYYYDLHVHSCLSPCGNEDNTPNNIAGMAKLCGIDILALTDHNSTKNCPAFFEAAEKYGIIPVAGMELTTSEDIHVVCLFEKLSDALRFDEHIDSCRTKFQNKPDIFGSQQILDGEDRLIGEVDDLLISASSVSIDQVSGLVKRYGGVCYPAHIDRDSNSIIAVLGTLPPDIRFDYYELHDSRRREEFSKRYSIPPDRFIIDSDAHYLTDMRDKECYFDLDCDCNAESVRAALFELLRRPLI